MNLFWDLVSNVLLFGLIVVFLIQVADSLE